MAIQYPKQLIKKKVISGLTEYITNNFKTSDISTEKLSVKNLKLDLNFDALDLTEVIIDIETELDCCIFVDDNEVLNKTVNEFIDYLYNYLNKKA